METSMRLPWRKARVPARDVEEATAARTAAGEHLALARERETEVRRVAGTLRELRESNHFSERLAAMLRESGHGHAPHA
jgi:hypothetical protein